MIEFEEAINVATTNAKSLVKGASDFELEGVLLSNDEKLYEVTLSYNLSGKNPLDLENNSSSGLIQLATLMGRRREYKVFLVDSSNGNFKGFKTYKDR